MPELPEILTAIRENPDDAARWLVLAGWLRDDGRDDEAAAVRVFYPVLRDSMAEGKTLESGLALFARYARILGRRAREIEETGIPTADQVD